MTNSLSRWGFKRTSTVSAHGDNLAGGLPSTEGNTKITKAVII